MNTAERIPKVCVAARKPLIYIYIYIRLFWADSYESAIDAIAEFGTGY